MSPSAPSKPQSSRQYLLLGAGGLAIFLVGVAGMYFLGPMLGAAPNDAKAAESSDEHEGEDHGGENAEDEGQLVFPKVQWKTADLKIAEVKKANLPTFKWVTGKLTVNRDQAAGNHPLFFLQMEISTIAGAEVQQPLASVMIGGVVTSSLLTLGVLPAIYHWFEPKSEAVEV